MNKTKKKLDDTLPIRLTTELKEKLEKIAIQKERSLSGQIRIILKDYIERIEI